MRNKARLSITGSVGENGRVLTPDCPKAVHAGHASLRHPGLAVVSSGLPWKPKNTCRALTTHKHTRTSTKTQTHTYIQKDLYIFSHTRTYMIIATEAQIFRYRETHFYTKHTHTHTASSFHISCCHWLILQKTDEYNCGANGVETEQWTTMTSHLPAAFFSF